MKDVTISGTDPSGTYYGRNYLSHSVYGLLPFCKALCRRWQGQDCFRIFGLLTGGDPPGLDEMRAYRPYRRNGFLNSHRNDQVFDTQVLPVLSSFATKSSQSLAGTSLLVNTVHSYQASCSLIGRLFRQDHPTDPRHLVGQSHYRLVETTGRHKTVDPAA